jgi:uncharacterized membrane protein
MTQPIRSHDGTDRVVAQVEEVTVAHPFRWLRAGWQDLRRAPVASIGYGALLTMASYLITLWVVVNPNFFHFLLPLLFGFFLVGPALGVGPYEISRRLERGEQPHLGGALAALWSRGLRVMVLGAFMLLLLIIWIGFVAAIFEGRIGLTPALGNALVALLSPDRLPLLLAGLVVGGLLALVVFLLTAVSAPMLLDRADVSAVEALRTSLAACRYNWRPMLIWAALIVVGIFAGFLTLYVGLIVGFPVIGHATWHAYRDLVRQ